MHQLIKKAFTLIELLVVIAIIGILSGLIVVAMGGMTQKAIIAKAQVFSNSLRNSLMMDIIGEYKFDENIGSTTVNSWNNSNNGTLTNFNFDSTDGWRSDSQCVFNSCLQFDGANDYVNLGTAFSVGIKTFNIWLKVPMQTDGEHILFSFGGTGSHNEFAISSGSTVNYRSILFLHNSDYRYWETSSYLDNNWHLWTVQITGITANDITNSALYIDGKLIIPGVTATSAAPIAWGNFWMGYNNTATINGIVDEFRVYNNILPTSQIREQYYVGLNSLLANGSINNKEYTLRINSIAQQ